MGWGKGLALGVRVSAGIKGVTTHEREPPPTLREPRVRAEEGSQLSANTRDEERFKGTGEWGV